MLSLFSLLAASLWLLSTAMATDTTDVLPRDLLLGYQQRYSADDAQRKIWLKARQIGGDFTQAEEVVRDALWADANDRKSDWVIAAPSERQSLLSFDKCRQWVEAYESGIEDLQIERRGSEAAMTAATITLAGGSRIVAVPGKPETVRGFTCNVVLTEFAYFERPLETWRALAFTTANEFSGQKKIRVLSTPNGIGNQMHKLWSDNYGRQDASWSCHRTSIHEAIKDGLPVNIESLRKTISDPNGWAQEMELEFLDASTVLLPYDLIATCESPMASSGAPQNFWSSAHEHPIDLGIDFGRTRNKTVCTAGERVGECQIVREILELTNMPTPNQQEMLRPRIKLARRVALDYTGPGIGLGDLLAKEFGEYDPTKHLFGKIELCTFTLLLKQEIFPKLRMAFEGKRIFIPISVELREDLHSVYRIITPAQHVTYAAPHSGDGHADRCNSLALLVRAGARGNISGTIDLI